MVFIILLFFVFIFLLGSALGSFASVWVDRDNRDEKFTSGRSYCEKCKHVLSVFDLIPVFSFISLRGACRYCKSRIPRALFFAELFFGFGFVLTAVLFFWKNGIGVMDWFNLFSVDLVFQLGFYLVLAFVLSVIFLSDLKYMVISDSHFLLLGGLYLIGYLVYLYYPLPFLAGFYNDIYSSLIGATTMIVFFGILVVASRERLMGQGDIYLAGLLALFLGWQSTLVMWFLAFLFGAILGLGLIMFGFKRFQSKIPFGPFLIIAFYICLFYGQLLFDSYIHTLGY